MSILKDTIPGIILLGVVSSVIATYVYEHEFKDNPTSSPPTLALTESSVPVNLLNPVVSSTPSPFVPAANKGDERTETGGSTTTVENRDKATEGTFIGVAPAADPWEFSNTVRGVYLSSASALAPGVMYTAHHKGGMHCDGQLTLTYQRLQFHCLGNPANDFAYPVDAVQDVDDDGVILRDGHPLHFSFPESNKRDAHELFANWLRLARNGAFAANETAN